MPVATRSYSPRNSVTTFIRIRDRVPARTRNASRIFPRSSSTLRTGAVAVAPADRSRRTVSGPQHQAAADVTTSSPNVMERLVKSGQSAALGHRTGARHRLARGRRNCAGQWPRCCTVQTVFNMLEQHPGREFAELAAETKTAGLIARVRTLRAFSRTCIQPRKSDVQRPPQIPRRKLA